MASPPASAPPPQNLPIRMSSKVVRGYGRGSKDLGVPTANLDPRSEGYRGRSFEELPTGIYWGFCRIGSEPTVYATACSIGYNPTYGNETKTVEPHLIAPDENDERRRASSCGESVLGDFYGESLRMSLVGYLRPELPFEGLERLIEAIKNDITNAVRLGNDFTDEAAGRERAWVASDSTDF